MSGILASALNVPIFAAPSIGAGPGAVYLPGITLSAPADAPPVPPAGIPAAPGVVPADRPKDVPGALTPLQPAASVVLDVPHAHAAPVPLGTIGVFTTPQSLMAFPVAASFVTLIWRVLARVFPSWGGGEGVALGIAFVVGIVIFINSNQQNATTLKDKFVAASVALFNSFALAATALGIHTAIT